MRILLVDARFDVRRAIRQIVASESIELVETTELADAVLAERRFAPDLALVAHAWGDEAGDRSGLAVVRALRAARGDLPIVLVGQRENLDDVLEAMRAGATDWVVEAEIDKWLVLDLVERAPRRSRRTPSLSPRGGPPQRLVGSVPAMQRVRHVVDRIADSDATVLIRGETGVGKEVVARALHAQSSRAAEPFIAVNCSALPGSLVESLVFGHERGAFTGAERRVRGQLELAGSGTLLLDEIAEMPTELQAKLLRVLEDRRFRPLGSEVELPLRARILASTNADLEALVREGRFRQDLLYRLDVVTIFVPPLVERLDDLDELLSALSSELPLPLRFTPSAVAWMTRRPWPGNVRELRNLVERVALLGDDETVDARALDALAADRPAIDSTSEVDRIARALLALPERVGSKLRVMERAVLHHAVEACGGNKSAAARLIGMNRKSLERRWDRHESELPEEDETETG